MIRTIIIILLILIATPAYAKNCLKLNVLSYLAAQEGYFPVTQGKTYTNKIFKIYKRWDGDFIVAIIDHNNCVIAVERGYYLTQEREIEH